MTAPQLPTYEEFISKIKKNLQERADVELQVCEELCYSTDARIKKYDFVKISSKQIRPEDKILLIRAGIHGDETAGPLTLMNHAGEIFTYAHERGVKLLIFPLDNPSGFEQGTRYNMEGDSGDAGNNDFMRYVLNDGSIVDDLKKNTTSKRWFWSSAPESGVHLPKETQALHRELKRLPLPQIKGCLDLHQDNFIVIPCSYHYTFDDCRVYLPIIEKIQAISSILKNEYIDSGYLNGSDYVAEIIKDGAVVTDNENPKSDEHGCVTRHDGSLPDLLYRLGSNYCVTVETAAIAPAKISDEVNLLWVYGMIDLVAE